MMSAQGATGTRHQTSEVRASTSLLISDIEADKYILCLYRYIFAAISASLPQGITLVVVRGGADIRQWNLGRVPLHGAALGPLARARRGLPWSGLINEHGPVGLVGGGVAWGPRRPGRGMALGGLGGVGTQRQQQQLVAWPPQWPWRRQPDRLVVEWQPWRPRLWGW